MTKSAFLAAAFTVLAGTASATTMQAVYTGTVYASTDATDSFGTGTVNGLDGLAYSLVFLYDTPAGVLASDWYHTQQYGGTTYGWVDPVISATLTINNVSFSSSGDYQSFEYRSDGGGTAFAQDYAYEYFDDSVTYSYHHIYDGLYGVPGSVPFDLSQPFSVTGPSGGGYFSFVDYDYGTALYSNYVFGALYSETLTVSIVSAAVPLPATLPLMLVALGGLAALRRRRTA